FEFSEYTQKSFDSLNTIGEVDFIIFNSIRNVDSKKCLFTYATREGKTYSMQCEGFSEELIKEVIDDWYHFQNNETSRFSKEPNGRHWVYYLVRKEDGEIIVEKLYR